MIRLVNKRFLTLKNTVRRLDFEQTHFPLQLFLCNSKSAHLLEQASVMDTEYLLVIGILFAVVALLLNDNAKSKRSRINTCLSCHEKTYESSAVKFASHASPSCYDRFSSSVVTVDNVLRKRPTSSAEVC